MQNGDTAHFRSDGGVINAATLVVKDCTISGNSTSGGQGGIYNEPGANSATLSGTIVAQNFGGDLGGTGFTGNHNLIGDGSGGLSAASSSHNILGSSSTPIREIQRWHVGCRASH